MSGYTGIALNNPCGPVDVYGTAAALPSLQAAVASDGPSGTFSFHAVQNDLATLLTIQNSITTDLPTLQQLGYDIKMYWPDMTTGLEQIQLVDASSDQLATLQVRYGVHNVLVVNASGPPIGMTATPINDSSPWSGGDAIEWTENASGSVWDHGCTAGPPAHDFTTVGGLKVENYFLLSAGHCLLSQAGALEANEPFINALSNLTGSDSPMGTGTGAYLNTNHADVMTISVPAKSTDRDWVGWNTSSSPRTSVRGV